MHIHGLIQDSSALDMPGDKGTSWSTGTRLPIPLNDLRGRQTMREAEREGNVFLKTPDLPHLVTHLSICKLL